MGYKIGALKVRKKILEHTRRTKENMGYFSPAEKIHVAEILNTDSVAAEMYQDDLKIVDIIRKNLDFTYTCDIEADSDYCEVDVLLEIEDNKERGDSAVAVSIINGLKVGYLESETAKSFVKELDKVLPIVNAATC